MDVKSWKLKLIIRFFFEDCFWSLLALFEVFGRFWLSKLNSWGSELHFGIVKTKFHIFLQFFRYLCFLIVFKRPPHYWKSSRNVDFQVFCQETHAIIFFSGSGSKNQYEKPGRWPRSKKKSWIFEENVFQTKVLQQISPGGSTVKIGF